jgi:GntR family transcriptional regulator
MHTQQQQLVDALHIAASGVPIYVQLRDQVLTALGRGALKPDDQMPTMRQVAVALRIDLNTVRRAYDELEAAGAITLERGRGSFVAQPPDPLHPELHAEALEALARQTLAAAKAGGVDPRALAARIAALARNKETDR